MNFDLIRICKPSEWLANLLVFLPLLVLQDKITQMLIIVMVALYFFLNLVTSAIYAHVRKVLAPKDYELNEMTQKVLSLVLGFNVFVFSFMLFNFAGMIFFLLLLFSSRLFLIKYQGDLKYLRGYQLTWYLLRLSFAFVEVYISQYHILGL